MENISYDDMSEPLCCNQAHQELTLRENMILKYLKLHLPTGSSGINSKRKSDTVK